MHKTISAEVLAERRQQGFHGVLGYRQVDWQDGYSLLELELRPLHLNMGGVVHGGVLTSLIDIACAQAGLYCPHPGRIRMAVTLALSMSFTGQASGGVILTHGRLRARDGRVFTASGEIVDAEGRVLALGEGTFQCRSGSEKPEGVSVG